MVRHEIPIDKFAFDPSFFDERWLLLTAGQLTGSEGAATARRGFNSMTISWGSVGQIWNKPFFQVVVRPTRYTFGFMEASKDFTLCVLPKQYKAALALLGSKSGRDSDKIRSSGLTPIASTIVAAPGYDEAELIVECSKMYWQDLDPHHFLDPSIDGNYSDADYHRAYFGEIVAVHGTAEYIKTSK